MQRDRNAYLWDIRNSIQLIRNFVENRQIVDYQRDAMLRSAVERQFEIIGEALAQLKRQFPDTAKHITSQEQIISFRNMLIHGYSFVSDVIVWSVIHTDLPSLYEEVDALLTASS